MESNWGIFWNISWIWIDAGTLQIILSDQFMAASAAFRPKDDSISNNTHFNIKKLKQVPGQLKDFILSIKNEYRKRNEQSTKNIDGETLLPTNGIHHDGNQSHLKSFTQAKNEAPRKHNMEPTSNVNSS